MPVFVDVGGSFGQQCARLKAKYPDLPGKIICQDLPATLKLAPQISGVKFMAQAIFEPNAVRGAKFYYIRAVLHDFPDEKCVQILRNLKEAGGKGSKILIDEIVLAKSGAHWMAMAIDIEMEMIMAACERTKDQWEAIAENAGLEVESMTPYMLKLGNSVIVLKSG